MITLPSLDALAQAGPSPVPEDSFEHRLKADEAYRIGPAPVGVFTLAERTRLQQVVLPRLPLLLGRDRRPERQHVVEHRPQRPEVAAVIDRLATLATGHEAPLVREAAAASLGAIGHPAGLPAILHACDDKPQIRRRAVLALAPFSGEGVEAAIDHALTDRDWQVRQAAEDLRRAERA